MAMESQETLEPKPTCPDPSMSALNCVDHSTLSTGQQPPIFAAVKDESVISNVTDPASLGGYGPREISGAREPSNISILEVPKHVIVTESGNGGGVVVSSTKHVNPVSLQSDAGASGRPVTEEAFESQSASALVETSSPQDRDLSERRARSVSDAQAIPAKTQQLGPEDYKVDEYFKSLEVQNAIVERSPGGRYVRFMEKLGSGASKDVYRAYDTQEGIEVAWNVVKLSGVPKNERNRIVNEVRLLERLHHQNIISFHGSWVNRERQEVNFVTEILSSGTLKSFINKVQVIRWKIAKRWALQILQGLEYLHSQEPPVIHRDLKCENIFINGTSGDLRIGDLGLSTVHRNGKALSVLGTPEFMAPDMYDDSPYDAKVDIYAFGMCMLEIFTKEIPYSECSNPAQIYKKVTNGEPPEVLSRLQSKHAKDFVLLCLGYKNEQGRYIRPSASELLKHPFLLKRANDDDEVMVDPPLRERRIIESRESSISPVTVPEQSIMYETVMPEQAASEMPIITQLPLEHKTEENPDTFEGMPESETNMKKIKVLMGRGTELEEEESRTLPVLSGSSRTGQGDTEQIPASTLSARTTPGSSSVERLPQNVMFPSLPPVQHSSPSLQPNYLVAAAVVHDESLAVRPYADDILKLVVTLPIDGQTQNVQFDFHLVEDDPVQVAKEMVQELRIPPEAVLEISETISGLARTARMRQDRYAVRMLNDQNLQNNQFQRQEQHSQGHMPAAVNELSQSSAAPSRECSQVSIHSSHNPSTSIVSVVGPAQQPQALEKPSLSPAIAVTDYGHGLVPSATYLPAAENVQGITAGLSHQYVGHQGLLSSNPGVVDNQPHPHLNSQSTAPLQHHFVPSVPTSHHTNESSLSFGQDIPPQTAGNTWSTQITGAVNSLDIADSRSWSQSNEGGRDTFHMVASANSSFEQANVDISKMDQHAQSRVDSSRSDSSDPKNAPLHDSTWKFQDYVPAVEDNAGNVEEASSSLLSDEIDSEDEDVEEELRKIDEDFQKNIQRARKVYDNRMDNLHRCQVEREAQHQKTLEKHEKERAEFEKRMAQEAEQQHKRIEQLQREWDKRRETLAAFKRRQLPKRRNSRNGAHENIEASASNDAASTDDSVSRPSHTKSLSSAAISYSDDPSLLSKR